MEKISTVKKKSLEIVLMLIYSKAFNGISVP